MKRYLVFKAGTCLGEIIGGVYANNLISAADIAVRDFESAIAVSFHVYQNSLAGV